MPSSQDLTGSARRPVLNSRHSSSSNSSVRSPMAEPLSTSAQGRRTSQRHVVHPRLGARVASLNRNLNKLAKLTAAKATDDTPSPRPSNVKRNSSNTHLSARGDSAALKKTYSETSLVRNRSTTNLAKNKSSTHLPRVASSRHVSKGARAQFVRSRRSVSHGPNAHQESAKPGARFDLDAEQAEIEDDVAQAKAEAESDEEKPVMTPAQEAKVNQVAEESEESSPQRPAVTSTNGVRATREKMPQFQFPQPQSQMSSNANRVQDPAADSTTKSSQTRDDNVNPDETAQTKKTAESPDRLRVSFGNLNGGVTAARDTDSDSITSKLLKRNQSASKFAPQPVVSDAEAVFKGTARTGRPSPKAIELSTPNASGQDLVSRFISISGGSSNNTPRNSHSLGKATPEDGWTEIARRNQSLTDVPSGQHHRQLSESSRSGVLTPVKQPPSRTQQKLWLERDFSNIESQQGRQPAFLRPNRSFALGLGPGLYPGNSEVRLNQAQQRQFHEQSSVEYRRIRMFQHPIALGVARLHKGGAIPRTKTPSRSSLPRSGLFSVTNNAPASEKNHGLSQSWNSRKTTTTTPSTPTTANAATRPGEPQARRKVTFQGLREMQDDSSVHKSLDDDEFAHARSERDEAREICRRLWELQAYASNE